MIASVRPVFRRCAAVACVAAAASASACEPKSDVPNSAHAAEACLDVLRDDSGRPDLELDDPNRARLDSSTLVYFSVVDGDVLVPYSCTFRFDVETQRYSVDDVPTPTD